MPEPVQVTKYKAFDGTLHDTHDDALAHEEANFASILCGLDRDQIDAALDRKPHAIAIADALEKAGGIIARKRREAGELRRASNRTTAPTSVDERPSETEQQREPEVA